MSNILDKLKDGDRRSIGKANEVAAQVLEEPSLFDELFQGMRHDDAVVRMRAADAIEKISGEQPELLASHKDELLGKIAAINQQEVRWHVAQMIPRLPLSTGDRKKAADLLFGFLEDDSKIVQTNALQALVDLSEKNPDLLPEVKKAVKEKIQTGSAAVKNRAQKLLNRLR